jgi:DNA modification methylase
MNENILNKVHNCDYLELLSKIETNSINVLITDPPFGINYQNNYTKQIYDKIVGDEKSFSYDILAKEAYRVLKDNSALFIFTGWSEYPHHFKEIEKAGFSMKEPLICQKRPSGKTDLHGSFQSNADWCIFAHKGKFKFKQTQLLKNKKAGVIPTKGRKPVPEFKTRFPSCWFGEEYPWSSENPVFQKKNEIYHPTIKSKEFIEWIIQISTEKGDVVLDPFLGSGTVAVASLSLDRNFIGCDILENYCKLSEKRINLKI